MSALRNTDYRGKVNQTNSAAPAMISNDMLTGHNGMTLYVSDNDVAGSGKSVCNGPCAANWPPLYAMDGAMPSGDYSIITRDDGKKQWASKGKPLHFWIKDQKPGDMSGDGFKNVWHVARP
jgi:predicted lipoprotein with Yx(FWY)xxD motif